MKKCTEWCSHCETEVEISTEMTIQQCPNCKKYIIPCSICDWDYTECGKCELSKICESKNNMENLDYYKEFVSGNTTITRCDYEDMASPMNTSSLSDDDMERLAKAIDQEMERWNEWLKNGDINQDQYDEQWWKSMEYLGCAFGMTYYEDNEV